MPFTPEDSDSPQKKITRWLPHVFLLALLLSATYLLLSVLAPLRDPLLFAMALAAVTYPFIYKPLERTCAHLCPRLGISIRQQICGPLAASALFLLCASPLFILLFTAGPSFTQTWAIIIGVLQHDSTAINEFASAISGQLENIHQIYPRLHLRPADMNDHTAVNHIQEFHTYVTQLLTTEQDINAVFMSFLKNGSNTVAELIMTFIALAFFYAHGPHLVRCLLRYTPINDAQQQEMARHHFQVIARLLSDTIGTAVVKGLCLGSIISLLTGHNFFLISILTAFLSLLPVIGLTMVWLPLSVLAWSNGQYTIALAIAGCSLLAHYGIDWRRNHYGRQLHDRNAWTSFLLFLGLVGGIISFGLKGFVVGPVVVILVAVLGRFWLPLYGFSVEKDDTDPFLTLIKTKA